MRKLLLILFLLFTVGTSHSQKKTELNPSLYGYWVNLDGEVLIIELNNTFTRRTSNKILAAGRLEMVNNEIRVIRTDIDEEYTLGFRVRNDIFVVTKPGSKNQAWLFSKVGN